jgi:16S rRNA (uracil1498-N3)-methyltransferase
MAERFFVESPLGEAKTAQLIDAEAHHLAKVMRASVGTEVVAFDGSGDEFVARVARIAKATVDLEILERRTIDRELPFSLTLAVALPKGDRQKVLVEKLVELGVTRLIPLDTRRGVAEATSSALARLRRHVIEASKQCRRNRLMEIAEPLTVEKLLSETPHDERRLFAHPSGQRLAATELQQSTTVAIGPEGGFSDEEVALAASQGWPVISLGPRILRIETAAIALAAVLGLPTSL